MNASVLQRAATLMSEADGVRKARKALDGILPADEDQWLANVEGSLREEARKIVRDAQGS